MFFRPSRSLLYRISTVHISPNHHQQTILAIHPALRCTTTSSNLLSTYSLHALTVVAGHTLPLSVNHIVISSYISQNALDTAQQVFDRMSNRNAVSYNLLISSYSKGSNVFEAFSLFNKLTSAGLRPTAHTFGAMLSCPLLSFVLAAQLHAWVLKSGLMDTGPFAATALVNFYLKKGKLDAALMVFDEMVERNLITWNTVISGYAKMGMADDTMGLFKEVIRRGIEPSDCTFLSVLSAFCLAEDVLLLEQIHTFLVKTDIKSCLWVANALLDAYAKCSATHAAEKYFSEMPLKDIVTWNTMLGAFSKNDLLGMALGLFIAMLSDRVLPNETTLATILGACSDLSALIYGEFVHAKAIKYNLDSSVYISCSLVDLYAKSNRLANASRAFTETTPKSVVLWNALISGYSSQGSRTAISLMKEMVHSGFIPNEFSFSSALKVASVLDLLQLHSLIIRLGYATNEYVSSALIGSYAAHGTILDGWECEEAANSRVPVVPINVIAGIYNREGQYQKSLELLSKLQEPDNVSWNILLTACARNGDYWQGFQLFKHMQSGGFVLDRYTAVCILNMCSKTNSLIAGASLHGLIFKTNVGDSEVFLNNILLDMYAKCGSLESSRRIFREMEQRNLISWTSLISGLGLHGYASEALEIFEQMEFESFLPDRVTFLAVLSACRHGGLVNEGMMIFERMQAVYKIAADMDHYICVVDLLCRYGYVKQAEHVIGGMPFYPNTIIWRIFLQGCKNFVAETK